MPVTAKLSRNFYERLGDEIATELVDWFNAVDATYRADLERLNELNFQRFAQFEQRFVQFEAKVEQLLAQADAKLERNAAELRGEFRTGLADQRAGLLKWMFGFWVATLVPLAGLILTLQVL